MKEERKHERAQKAMRDVVRYWLAIWQVPSLENEDMRASNVRTVPVGKRFARLAVLARVFWTGRLHFIPGRGAMEGDRERDLFLIRYVFVDEYGVVL